MRYFYHPESGSLFTEDTDEGAERALEDGLVIEIERDEYWTGVIQDDPEMAALI